MRLSIYSLLKKIQFRIIQYKEIYEELEEIADSCQSVANTFRNNHYEKRVRSLE